VTISDEDAPPRVPDALRPGLFAAMLPGASAESSPGVGVGLSLVARFAELHGGHAWVEDREGGGASFRVFLADAPDASA
jgi:K+-sensing histidine kinase KdpD